MPQEQLIMVFPVSLIVFLVAIAIDNKRLELWAFIATCISFIAIVLFGAINSHLTEIQGFANSFAGVGNAYQNFGDNMGNFWDGFNGLLTIGFWAGAAYAVYYFVVVRKQKKQEFEKSPEHPFQVNVAVVPFKTTGVLNVVRGRPLTHFLEVDVKISPKDWQRIKDAGLYDAVLFEYPDPTSTYSGEMREYNVRDLQIKGAASFYNLGQAQEARETLLKNIVNLKAAVEVQKEGRQQTSFEL
jgi:hypothetical protein